MKTDDGSPARTPRTQVENSAVKASDLPPGRYSVEGIEWKHDLYSVTFKVRDPEDTYLLPWVIAASLSINVDVGAAQRQVDNDTAGRLFESEPVLLDSADIATTYSGPVRTPDGSGGWSASVWFSVNDVSGFVAIMGRENAVDNQQAVALAERVAQRLSGKQPPREPAF